MSCTDPSAMQPCQTRSAKVSPQPPHPASTKSPPQGWRGAECEAVVEEQPSADGDGAGAAPGGLSSASPGMSQAVKADRTGPVATACCPSLAVRHRIRPGQRDLPGPAEPSGLCQPVPCLPCCLAPRSAHCLEVGSGGPCLRVLMVTSSTSDWP